MPLQQLRTFVTVARTGNLTRAADALHLTQPALSGQLKRLEDRLGIKLLSRTSTGMALTAAGRTLLSPAENVLAALEMFNNTAKSLEERLSGRLNIGLIMLDPDFLKLGEIVSVLKERHPDITIDLNVRGVDQCIAGVQNGALDAAFFAGGSPHPYIKALPLYELEYRVIAPTMWRQQLQSTLLGSLALLPWIRAPKPSAHYELVNSLFRHSSIQPQQIIEVDHESVVVSLVKAGVGLSLIRQDLAYRAAEKHDVLVWEHAPALSLPLSLIYHEHRHGDPLVSVFIETLREVWDAGDGNS